MRTEAAILFFLLTIGAEQISSAASITGFSPPFGQPGNIVTISGSGFSATSALAFDANNPTPADFIILSDTALQTVVPVGATTGPLSLALGGSTLTFASNFVVAPSISGFNPPSGKAESASVSIFGANFVTGGTTVQFTGSAAVAGTVTASSQVNATAPAGTTNGPITVSTSAGSVTSTNSFIVSTAPIITDFSPTIGTNLSTVVVDGANFVSGATTVKFNGTASTSVAVVSTTQLRTVVPSGAKTGAISVSANGATFTTSSNFTTASGLVVTGFDPPYGKAGTTVNISGVGLQGTATASVKFNGVAAIVTANSDTQIQVAVPSSATTGAISVSNSKGTFTTTSNFTFLTGPFVTDFSPTVGPVGTSVVIDGLNFTAGSPVVKFNGKTATSTVTSDTQLTATVPSGASSGTISVAIGTSTFDTSSNFTITTAAPFISSFSPTNAVRGEAVTISGANFSSLATPAVKFNGVAASNEPVEASTQLTAYVPANATSGLITVSGTAGTATSPSIIYLQPWITNFSPGSGYVYSNLTIVGRNFTNATSVTVGGISYSFRASATQIVATVPTNAAVGPVRVTTPGGVIISSNAFGILPNIFGFSPVIGPPNTIVTITGTSLSNVTSILFGGGTPTAPLTKSFGQVTAALPSNAITGPITIYTPAGNATTISNFTVTGNAFVTLTKTADNQALTPGENVSYTLLLTNIGPSMITSVIVTDSLPIGLDYVSGSTSVGAITFTNPTVYWSMPPLARLSSASATITATATASSLYTNIAGVTFAEGPISGGFHVATSAVYFVSASARTLAFAPNSAGLVLSWPASGVGLTLQSNTNLDEPTNWNIVNSSLVDGTNYFTNPTTLPLEFFRLKTP